MQRRTLQGPKPDVGVEGLLLLLLLLTLLLAPLQLGLLAVDVGVLRMLWRREWRAGVEEEEILLRVRLVLAYFFER